MSDRPGALPLSRTDQAGRSGPTPRGPGPPVSELSLLPSRALHNLSCSPKRAGACQGKGRQSPSGPLSLPSISPAKVDTWLRAAAPPPLSEPPKRPSQSRCREDAEGRRLGSGTYARSARIRPVLAQPPAAGLPRAALWPRPRRRSREARPGVIVPPRAASALAAPPRASRSRVRALVEEDQPEGHRRPPLPDSGQPVPGMAPGKNLSSPSRRRPSLPDRQQHMARKRRAALTESRRPPRDALARLSRGLRWPREEEKRRETPGGARWREKCFCLSLSAEPWHRNKIYRGLF